MMASMAKLERESDSRGAGRDGIPDGDRPRGEAPAAGVTSEGAAPAEARIAAVEGRETLRILRDDPGHAVERLRARIRSGEADWRTWHNLAIALDRVGDRRHAIDAAENALSRNADSASTWFLLGLLLRHADRFDESIAALDRVAALSPRFPRLHATRGVCHFHRGDHDAARRDLAEALSRSPEDATSLFNLAIVHVAAKEYLRAQECVERLIALEPERAGHYYRFLVELGEVRALDETLTQTHRIKNLLSVTGDRLRRFYAEWGERLDPEGREDLRAIRDDLGSVYGDMVGLLGVICP
jgi:tetratricopeptide (TPR) repeat protein